MGAVDRGLSCRSAVGVDGCVATVPSVEREPRPHFPRGCGSLMPRVPARAFGFTRSADWKGDGA